MGNVVTVSYRLEFEDVVLSEPTMGDCTNDTVIFSGFDANSMGSVPMSLCGSLTDQHIVLNLKNVNESSKIIFSIVPSARMAKWRMKAIQLSCTDSYLTAPAGCLTYNIARSGYLQSYNYNAGNGEMINNQKFSHCIKYQHGFCDISLAAITFDLGKQGDFGDSLRFGCSMQTGSMFGTSGSLMWNFTGPYIVAVSSDDM